MMTYAEMIQYLAKREYHFYMNGGCFFSFDRDLVEAIYGVDKEQTADDLKLATHAIWDAHDRGEKI